MPENSRKESKIWRSLKNPCPKTEISFLDEKKRFFLVKRKNGFTKTLFASLFQTFCLESGFTKSPWSEVAPGGIFDFKGKGS